MFIIIFALLNVCVLWICPLIILIVNFFDFKKRSKIFNKFVLNFNIMRHYYKTHGKHCYLRFFQNKCPKYNDNILFWECTHGSKYFFEYPPFGRFLRHFYRISRSTVIIKKNFRNIVKKQREISLKKSPSCPICGKLFKNAISLKKHIEDSKKIGG